MDLFRVVAVTFTLVQIVAGLLLNTCDKSVVCAWPIHSVEGGPWVTHIIKGWSQGLGVELTIAELEKLSSVIGELREIRQSQTGIKQV